MAHPKRQILSSVSIVTIPSFRCSSLVETRPSFGSVSQALLVCAKSRLASLFWHASSRLRKPSVKLPLCPSKAHNPKRSAPKTAALKTLHLHLKFTFAFQNCPMKCQAFQAALILISPSGGEGRVPGEAVPQVAHFRLGNSRQNPLSCCLRQSH